MSWASAILHHEAPRPDSARGLRLPAHSPLVRPHDVRKHRWRARSRQTRRATDSAMALLCSALLCSSSLPACLPAPNRGSSTIENFPEQCEPMKIPSTSDWPLESRPFPVVEIPPPAMHLPPDHHIPLDLGSRSGTGTALALHWHPRHMPHSHTFFSPPAPNAHSLAWRGSQGGM